MIRDEDDPFAKYLQPHVFPRKLDGMAVAAMQEYIAELEAEIVNVRAEIDKRGSVKAKAEALFK